MSSAKIVEIEQTDRAGLFSICFESDSLSEYDKFINKFIDNAQLESDLNRLLNLIRDMIDNSGFLERYFRPEGKYADRAVALPIMRNNLRLYCLRLSDSVLIVGNGGVKDSKTYQENAELNGYVITLQKLDALLKDAEKNGTITIEKANILGITDQTFNL